MAKTVRHQDLKSYWGERDHLEQSQSKSFSAMIFEALSEREPTPSELKIFDLILNLSIDHGPETPSAIPLIESAKKGESLSQALAQGILQINEHHGGAVEGAMKNLYRIMNQESGSKDIVEEYRNENKKMPGFGHRIYKESDPRTALIFGTLKIHNLGQQFIDHEEEIKQELESQTGKNLPINIDGAIAVVLCSFGWKPELGNAVFIIARIPGLCAHFLNNSHSN